jgi:hypothetical protein
VATSRTSYGKLQRDRAKKERQQIKREKRFDRTEPEEGGDLEEEVDVAPVRTVSTEDILERVAELHRRFDDEEIEFDEFEEQKAALMAQLMVD